LGGVPSRTGARRRRWPMIRAPGACCRKKTSSGIINVHRTDGH
jgi:hypothetical protein